MNPVNTLDRVPIVDIGLFMNGTEDQRRQIAEVIDRTNQEIGFLVIKGHGFDLDLLARWFDVSKRFFEGPGSVKRDAMQTDPTVREGYHGQGLSGLAAKEGEEAPPDLREYFMVGRPDLSAPIFSREDASAFYHENVWPVAPSEFKAVGTAYYEQISQLGRKLMQLFALALKLPENWFDDKIDHDFSVVSSIYYPAQKTVPLPGQLRAGAHTDYGQLDDPGTDRCARRPAGPHAGGRMGGRSLCARCLRDQHRRHDAAMDQ